ncbi:MAG TPA: hypothetical protein ENK37_06905 [Oceanithermus profundus]|uniref:SbsA Ig-like domain-containing protein n=1 Tax=Oceanithermus profundus TaxID=187137 RepID=A0A7C4VKZ4_9DEIN|nr:hypothetical protein [Oceanithermus profundus]
MMTLRSRPFRAWMGLALAAGLVLAAASCGSSGGNPGGGTTLELASHTPAANASGVLLADAITLTFNNAVTAAAVTPSTVKVLDGSTALNYEKELSADGKTLTLTLTSAPASLPADLTVQIEGLAGSGGGSLTTSFSFTTAADWVELGGAVQEDTSNDADNPSVALDAAGNLVVAFDYGVSAGYRIAVRRWNGSAWESIGAPFNSGSSDNAYKPRLALDSTGKPVVAWVEYNATDHNNVFVRHWDGSQWIPYGSSDTPLDLTDSDSTTSPAVALNSNDDPAVAFAEQSLVSGTTAWHVYHGGYSSGFGWVFNSNPDNHTAANDALIPAAAMNASNQMILAWVEDSASGKGIYVKNVGADSFLGTGPLKHADDNSIPFMDMELNADGNPVVVWREQSNGSGLYAKYYDGSTWKNFGSSDLATANGFHFAMALDSSGYPVIAYGTSSGANINLLVTRWDGAAWVALPGNVNLDPTRELYAFDCAVDGNDNPIVVWSEDDGSGGYVLHAKRFNGLAK